MVASGTWMKLHVLITLVPLMEIVDSSSVEKRIKIAGQNEQTVSLEAVKAVKKKGKGRKNAIAELRKVHDLLVTGRAELDTCTIVDDLLNNAFGGTKQVTEELREEEDMSAEVLEDRGNRTVATITEGNVSKFDRNGLARKILTFFF